ncbi:hypothetical protein P262_04247 [Cronobacter malonaticus]|uniref:Uncharacterized protein n=1 Tax=Cronobacter malonaticus TaxID=413503 RepID=V5U2L7_9ENTR|nr:hypothetical protein P262_04247 [Cronobacter malonaticus]CCJ95663.1 hypothetical protein BN131_3336 [Cronobacter malonaticus 681]
MILKAFFRDACGLLTSTGLFTLSGDKSMIVGTSATFAEFTL